jgi:hypothetical protein
LAPTCNTKLKIENNTLYRSVITTTNTKRTAKMSHCLRSRPIVSFKMHTLRSTLNTHRIVINCISDTTVRIQTIDKNGLYTSSTVMEIHKLVSMGPSVVPYRGLTIWLIDDETWNMALVRRNIAFEIWTNKLVITYNTKTYEYAAANNLSVLLWQPNCMRWVAIIDIDMRSNNSIRNFINCSEKWKGYWYVKWSQPKQYIKFSRQTNNRTTVHTTRLYPSNPIVRYERDNSCPNELSYRVERRYAIKTLFYVRMIMTLDHVYVMYVILGGAKVIHRAYRASSGMAHLRRSGCRSDGQGESIGNGFVV